MRRSPIQCLINNCLIFTQSGEGIAIATETTGQSLRPVVIYKAYITLAQGHKYRAPSEG